MTVYNSIVRKPTDGSTRAFTFSFAGGYVSRDYVKVRFTDAAGTVSDVPLVESNWTGPYQLTFATAFPAGGVLMIYRDTPKDKPIVDFADGSIINERNLDSGFDQAIHAVAELWDRAADVDELVNQLIVEANEATQRSIDAMDTADAANSKADNAVTTAAQALAGVTGATEAAQAATEAANAANTAATVATQAAVDSLDTAAAALTTAQTAASTANAAASVANAIDGKAQSALDASAAATATANGVDAKAQSALDASATATSTANAAVLTANDAKSTAEAIDGKADTAIDTANRAMMPVGMVLWWPDRTSVPAGFIPADGQLLNRATYPDLLSAAIGGVFPTVSDTIWLAQPLQRGKYTAGNGTTTFRVPDYNGRYAGSFAAAVLRGDGARSTQESGLIQLDAMQRITGHLQSTYATAVRGLPSDSGAFSKSTGRSGPTQTAVSFSGSQDMDDLRFDSGDSPGAKVDDNETRMLNVTGCWVIRAFGATTNPGAADAAQLATDYAALNAAFQSLQSKVLGNGQGLADVKASRNTGVDYLNNTGRPILVSIQAQTSAANGNIWGYINGFITQRSTMPVSGAKVAIQFTVPHGATYQVATSSISAIDAWFEYRNI